MPRKRRIDWPGAVNHVMMRGIDGRRIFDSGADQYEFIRRLSRILPEEDMRCFAWALMSNHVHLAVQTGTTPLPRVMQRLNGGFAQRFNQRVERKGYVFQDRYRSRLVLEDSDLMGLVRYVLRNPLAAALVSSLAELEAYPWCGYGALLGSRVAYAFECVPETLALFSDRPNDARRRLRIWMSSGLEETLPAASPEETEELRFRAMQNPEVVDLAWRDLDVLIGSVCGRFGIGRSDLVSASKRRELSQARAAIAYLAMNSRIPAKRVAQVLHLTPSAVSQASARGRSVVDAMGLRFGLKPRI